MKKEIEKILNNLEVSFLPTNNQIDEIERWLIIEQYKTKEGFYCNWDILLSSYLNKQLAIISQNNNVIGFVTWRITSEYTARIEIAEIEPEFRGKGVVRELIHQLFNLLRQKNIVAVDLQCTPASSEPAWKHLGFHDFPENSDRFLTKTPEAKKLYINIIPSQEKTFNINIYETIELWNDEPDMTKDQTQATFNWNIEFKNGTRELLKPIIFPGKPDWRIRWKANGITIKDDKVKYFVKEIDFGEFIIIKEIPKASNV